MEITVKQVTDLGLQILGAVAVLVGGWIVAGLLRRAVARAMKARSLDPSLTGFVSKLVYAAILVFALLAALSQFGVEVTSFVAVLGAASFAVGLALQGSLSNFAAGVMLLMHRPLCVGDYVEVAGIGGTVKEIRLFDCVLATPDNVRVTIPNGKIYGDIIRNYSVNPTRRLDIAVGIAYDADIARALEVTLELARADSRLLPAPEPVAMVGNLGDSSVDLILRVWMAREDYWSVKFDLTRGIKEAFDRHGIEIPFPQRVVHMAGAAD